MKRCTECVRTVKEVEVDGEKGYYCSHCDEFMFVVPGEGVRAHLEDSEE